MFQSRLCQDPREVNLLMYIVCLNVCPEALFLTVLLSDYFGIGGLRIWPYRIECFLHDTSIHLGMSAPQWRAVVCITVFILTLSYPWIKKCVHRCFFNWLCKRNRLNVVVYLCINIISELLKYWLISLHNTWKLIWSVY